MIEDIKGNQISGDLASLKSMLSSMMQENVTKTETPDANKSKEMGGDQIKKISEMLLKLDKSFNIKEISDSIKHLNQVVSSAQNSQTSVIKETQGSFKNIDSSLSKMFGGFSGMQQAIEKGTSDIASNLAASLENRSKSTGGDTSSFMNKISSSIQGIVKSITKSSSPSASVGTKDIKSLKDAGDQELQESGIRKKNFGLGAKFYEAGLKPGSIHVKNIQQVEYNKRMIDLLQKLNDGQLTGDQFERSLDKLNSTSKAPEKLSDQPQIENLDTGLGKATSKLGKIRNIVSGVAEFANLAAQGFNYLAGSVEKIGDTMGLPNTMVTVFGAEYKNMVDASAGMIKQERLIAIEAKKIAYETQGITRAQEGLQEEMMVTEDTVERTGFARIKFQKQLLEFQRKGIQDQTVLKNIVASQLNIEKQLGMEAGDLGDDFIKLHQEAGFTSVQIGAAAKGMLSVARSSGLTGKELRGAMESSKQILENMKNATTLTAQSIVNVTSVMAEAQKLGVTKDVSTLLEAASSSSSLFFSASEQTKNLLYQAAGSVGRIDELQSGILANSKDGMRDLAKGYRNVFEQVAGVTEKEFLKLDAAAKREINLRFSAQFGKDSGQFLRGLKAMEDGSKTYSEKLKEAEKQIIKNGKIDALQAEKNALAENKIADLQKQASSDVLTSLNEQIKLAGTGPNAMADAMQLFDRELAKSTDMQETLLRLTNKKNISELTQQEKVQALLKHQVEAVNKGLEGAGKGEFKIDASEIETALKSPEGITSITEKISMANEKLLAEQKTTADKALEVEQKLLVVNEGLSKISYEAGKIAEKNLNANDHVATALTAVGASMAANTAALIANTLALGLDFLSNIKDFGGSIKNMFGFGKGGAKAAVDPMMSKLGGGAKSAVDPMMAKLSSFANKTPTLMEKMLSPWKTLEKSGGLISKTIGGVAKKLPLIGGVVDFGMRMASGEGVGKAATGAGGAMAGGAAGLAAGAAIGTLIFPGLGTAVGGFIGSIIGSIGGSEIGSMAYDNIVKPFIGELPKIWEGITGFFSQIPGWLYAVLDTAILTPWKGLFELLGIKDWLYDYIWSPFATFFGGIGSAVLDWLKPIWNAITSVFGSIASWFGSWGSTIWEFLYKGASAVGLGWLLGKGSPPKGATPPTGTPSVNTAASVAGGATAVPASAVAVAASAPVYQATPATGPSGVMTPPQRQAAMATTTSGSAGDMGSYLASIAKSGETEASASQQMIQLMQKMIEVMSSGGTGSARPAYANAPPPRTDNYFKLPTGNFNESSIREVTNL